MLEYYFFKTKWGSCFRLVITLIEIGENQKWVKKINPKGLCIK